MSPAREPVETPLSPGTPVEKINSLRDHAIQNGARGRVVEALGPSTQESEWPGRFGYFVVWDAQPEVKLFCAGSRLRRIVNP